MTRFLSSITVLLLIVAGPSHALDIVKDEHTLRLTGTITKGDLRKILDAVTPPTAFPKYFTLDSPGGDILEAITIGRFIREAATGTFVPKSCMSACVFLLVAGVSQSALDDAAIGLHRPYFDPKEFAGLSLPDAEKKYKLLQAATRRYLEDMEMPTAAIEKMFSISSDDMYYLTPQEKARLLSGPSAYPEWIRAKCSPPTASEWELFKARGFNIFARFDNRPPSDPRFWAFISKVDQAEKCERNLLKDVRQAALIKFGKP